MKKTMFLFLLVWLFGHAGGQDRQGPNSARLADQQSREIYEKGQLSFILKKGAVPKDAMYEEILVKLGLSKSLFGISSLKPAFALAGDEYPDLQRIYTIYFTNYAATDQLLAALSSSPFVELAQKDPKYYLAVDPNDYPAVTPSNPLYHLNKVNASGAWNIGTGDMKIKIAVIDGSINIDHEDIAANVWENKGEIPGNDFDDDGNLLPDDNFGWDFGDNDNNVRPSAPLACSGLAVYSHGSHVAGIACGVTNNNVGISALSHNVSLIPIKCSFDADDQCGRNVRNVRDAFFYAVKMGANVINMSLSSSASDAVFQLAINEAHASGIVIVAAAGNDADDIADKRYPAAFDHVISVGSTDDLDIVALSSNYGSTIDLMAPGENIFSCYGTSNNAYGDMSGTSMATPLVSSLCALMLSQQPGLSPDALEACLKNTAVNINSLNDPKYNGKTGAGRIDADAAMQCLSSTGPAIVDFSSNFQTVCPGQQVKFLASGNITGFNWSFPGGVADFTSIDNPTVTYATPGIYDVSITGSNAGSSASVTKQAYIRVINNSTNYSGKVDNHWHFGEVDIDFGTGNPVRTGGFVFGGLNGAAAAISNADGQFLFSSDGVNLYDRSRALVQMASGGIYQIYSGNGASNVLIVPEPGTCKSKYYVFLVPKAGNGCAPTWSTTGLTYSIMDMNLNNGFGQVTTVEQPVSFPGGVSPQLTEKITATLFCDGTGVWVVVKAYNSNVFYSIPVTGSGVGTAVASTAGAAPICNGNSDVLKGQMKISPDGSHLSAVYPKTSAAAHAELFDFNTSTGAVTLAANQPVFSAPLNSEWYSTEFSPDGNVVYYGRDDGNIYQYNIANNTSGSVAYLGGLDNRPGYMELAPDHKIYCSNFPPLYPTTGIPPGDVTKYQDFLSVIQQPDVYGTGCTPTLPGFKLNMSTPSAITVLANGFISKSLYNQQNAVLHLPEDVLICQGATYRISSSLSAGGSPVYQWYSDKYGLLTGETLSYLDVDEADVYTLVVTVSGCMYKASVEVLYDELEVSLGDDQVGFECGGEILLDAGAGYTSYNWSTGETSREIKVLRPGTYSVTVSNANGCTATDLVEISGEPCCISDPAKNNFQQIHENPAPYNNGKPVAVSCDEGNNVNWVLERKTTDAAYLHRVAANGELEQEGAIAPAQVSGLSWVMKDMALDGTGNPLLVGDNGDDIYLGNFDASLLSTFEKVITTTGADASSKISVASVVKSYDNSGSFDGYLVLAQRKFGTPEKSDIALFKVDANGVPVSFSKVYSFSSAGSDLWERPYEVIQCKDASGNNDGYIVLASQQVSGVEKGLLLKIENNGSLFRAYHLPHLYYSIIQVIESGIPKGFIMSGSEYSPSEPDPSAKNARMVITRLDEYLNHDWTKAIKSFTYNLTAFSDGTWSSGTEYLFTMGGLNIVQPANNGAYVYVAAISYDPQYLRYEYYLLKMTITGSLQELRMIDRNINALEDHGFEDDPKHLLAATPEGGVIFLGSENQFSLVKADGSLNSGCTTEPQYQLTDLVFEPVMLLNSNTANLLINASAHTATSTDIFQSTFKCCSANPSLINKCKEIGDIGFNMDNAADATLVNFAFDENTQNMWDLGEEIDGVEWHLGNGQVITDDDEFTYNYPNYSTAQTYNIKLIVKFKNGCNLIREDVVTISCNWNHPGSVLNPAATKDFIHSVTLVANDMSFNVVGGLPPDFSAEWDFGDGTTGSGENVIHHYTFAGDYEVCLTIRHKDGCERKICRTIRVCDNRQIPLRYCEADLHYKASFHNFDNAAYFTVQKMLYGPVQTYTMPVDPAVNLEEGLYRVVFYDAEDNVICISMYEVAPQTATQTMSFALPDFEYCPLNGVTGKWVNVCDYINPVSASNSFKIYQSGSLIFNSEQYVADYGTSPCISILMTEGSYEVKKFDREACTYLSYTFDVIEKEPLLKQCSIAVTVPCEGADPQNPDDYPVGNVCHDCSTGLVTEVESAWTYLPLSNSYVKTFTDVENCRQCTYEVIYKRENSAVVFHSMASGNCVTLDLTAHMSCLEGAGPSPVIKYYSNNNPTPVTFSGTTRTLCCGPSDIHYFEYTAADGCVCKFSYILTCLAPDRKGTLDPSSGNQADPGNIETGVREEAVPAGAAFVLIPNPTAAVFRIYSSARIPVYDRVEITDMLGRKIADLKDVHPDYEFNMVDQAQGAYLVKVYSRDNINVLRLTLSH